MNPPLPPPGTWTRREFLTALGAAGLLRPAGVLGAAPTPASPIVSPLAASIGRPRYRVVRPRDLLSFELELLNLEVVLQGIGKRQEMHIISHGADGFVVLHFTGQHIAEQAIWDRGGQQVTTDQPNPGDSAEKQASGDAPAPLTYRLWPQAANGVKVEETDTDRNFLQRTNVDGARRDENDDMLHGLSGAWISGPSRLVFQLPQRLTPLRFELEEILRLCAHELDLVVAPGVAALSEAENKRARDLSRLDGEAEAAPGFHPGGLHQEPPWTSVEFPSLLNLSPYRSARWRLRPAEADGRAELWGLELEAPERGPLAGKPRLAQPRGHLFAFGWRSALEARWPIGLPPFDAPNPKLKYHPKERPKTALYEATRKLLVNQLIDDNGDIVAERFRLSALGTSARLHYAPVIDVPEPGNREGARTPDKKAAASPGEDPNGQDAEGMLTEWQQKTESGRDFYTKESFSGYWMPFGFKGEVVTITERLFCSAADAPPGAVLAQKPDAEAVVDVAGDESRLTAFLVARKFGRIRGSRVKHFPAPESADFSDVHGEAGRAPGMSGVEILVERTPILANQAASARNLSEQVTRIAAGEDVIVDAGAGIDAAREIFWPRVQDFMVNEQGKKERRLVVYKFPVRYTFFDGSTRTTEVPMLFVPTLEKGEDLYPHAKEELRTCAIGGKIPLVTPPPPAALAPGDLGAPSQIVVVGEHLRKFLPGSFGDLLPNRPKEPEKLKEFLAHPPAFTAGAIATVTEGFNLALGHLSTEIARRVTSVRDQLKEFAAAEDKFTEQIGNFAKLAEENVEQFVQGVQRDVQRVIAWGEDLLETVDATAAAERLQRLIGTAPARVAEGLAFLEEALAKVKGLPPKALEELQSNLRDLKKAVKSPEEYATRLKTLLIHWAVSFGPVWKRSDWDEAFQKLAETVDGASAVAVRLATLQKELQRLLLRGRDKSIEIGGRKVSLPKLETNEKTKIVADVVEKELQKAVDGVLKRIQEVAVAKVDALERLLSAVEAALGEERMLLARLRHLIQDHAALSLDQRRAQVERVVSDVGHHLLFVLTHDERGRERWERFLRRALAAEELVRAARDQVAAEWEKVQSKVRAAVQDTVKKGGEIVDQGRESVKKLLMLSNPEQLKQRLEDFGHLTGDRLATELREAFGHVGVRAAQLLERLQAFANKEAALAGDTRANLEELFALARELSGTYRAMLESLLKASLPELTALLNKLPDEVGAAKKVARRFAEYAAAGRVDFVSWRLGAAARDVVTDVQRALAAAETGVRETTEKQSRSLQQLGKQLDTELRKESAASRETLRSIQAEVETVRGRLDAELQARIDALRGVVDTWASSVEKRMEDLLEHFIVALWGALAKAEATFESALKILLSKLGQSALAQALELFPQATEVAAQLRRLTGEAENIEKSIAQLGPDAQKQANEFLKTLNTHAQQMGEHLADGLRQRLGHLEGDLLAMGKRAALSLPSPALLHEFQDQARKAIFHTQEVLFSVQTLRAGAVESVRDFIAHPRLENLKVRLPGVEGFPTIKHAEEYLKQGLRDAKHAKNEVFAEIQGAAKTALQNSGVADVAAQVGALSRSAGNLAATARAELARVEDGVRNYLGELRTTGQVVQQTVEQMKQDLKAQASDLLPAEAKLFNVIPLTRLLQIFGSPGELPKTIARELPDRIERSFSLNKEAKPCNALIVSFQPDEGCRFRMDSRATVWIPGPGRPARAPSTSIRGQLDGFRLIVATLLQVNFVSLSFVSENGSFQCVPRLGKKVGGKIDQELVVEFLGALSFVNDLRKALGKLLADNGLILAIESDMIYAGIKIRIPDITLGAVAVTNIALNMSLGLPLGRGPLRLRFALCDPINTFRVAVTIFAGGGFLALELASQPEYCKVEVAIEFGGSLTLSVGFASGSVSVMAGLYYSWSGSSTIFAGYIRVCGVIVVLGFIEVSIVIYLALGYQNVGGKSQLHGIATITIRVKIGFFSKSFSLTYEKTIGGSDAPKQDQAMLEEPSPWDRAPRRLARNNRLAAQAATGVRAAGPAVPDVPKPKRFSESMEERDFVTYWRGFDDRLTADCRGRTTAGAR
jgi:hypothetical protein